jgi:hypothetical protein
MARRGGPIELRAAVRTELIERARANDRRSDFETVSRALRK